jgi:hypothetical protein
MNHIGNIEKHVTALKEEVEKLTEYHSTYNVVMPEILSLMDKLFEEPSIKSLSNYVHLSNIYYEPIKDMINPGNFKQLKREIQLPGVYDPPSVRNKRVPGANSKKKTSPKKKTAKTTDAAAQTNMINLDFYSTTGTINSNDTTSEPAISEQDENSYYSIAVGNDLYYYETNTNIVYDDCKQNVGRIDSSAMYIGSDKYKFKEVRVHERDDDYISLDGEVTYNKILDDNLNIGIISV